MAQRCVASVMNIATFFHHYGLTENPFRAEEARHDAVFTRIEEACFHPDFEKICGDFDRPAAAIVFGERGAGKTAIRLQIEQRLAAHNAAHPQARCLSIPYDDLNPVLDRYTRHAERHGTSSALARFRLSDHMDAMLATMVPLIVDQVLGQSRAGRAPLVHEGDLGRRLRQLDRATRLDLLLLQLCYDRPETAAMRTRRLRAALRYRARNRMRLMSALALTLGMMALLTLLVSLVGAASNREWAWNAAILALGVAAVSCGGAFGWLWLRAAGIARDLARRLRVLDRPAASFRRSLAELDLIDVLAAGLPRSDEDGPRYAMLNRLLNVIRPLGYQSIMILVDRIDEPTLVNGDPQRMQALIWPMLSSTFLQRERLGVKLLLPLDLRHLLARESPEFFREARLDKQNLIERLSWSGAVLYDLCTARLNACRAAGAAGDGSRDEPITLRDLFEPAVTHQDLIDALDQMQQPRDAFKLIYRVIQEHCSNVPEAQPQWAIPRPVLDAVRKQEVERLGGMLRGVRPS